MDEKPSVFSALSKPLREAHLLAAVLAISALTYMGALRFDFVSTDDQEIINNPFIRAWSSVPRFFLKTVWTQMYPQEPHSFYRPIYLLWDLVNYSLFGLNPVGWHATAILLHLLVTGLVYRLIRKMAPDRPALAWLTALIFGIHPIHHEVVAWISGATESLYAAFFLTAFLAYLNSRVRSRVAWMAISCALYGFAVFSKETAIVLPSLVFAHAWISTDATSSARPGGWSSCLWHAGSAALVYLPMTAIYLGMRLWVLSSFGQINVPMSGVGLISTWPSVLFFYLRHWFLPRGYAAYYDMAYYNGLHFYGVILPAAVLACVVAGLWIGKRRLGMRETQYAAAWTIVPLLPALYLGVFRMGELAHDRYFYVPSIGAALLVALLLEPIGDSGARVWGQSQRLVFVGLALAAVLSLCTVAAVDQWSSNLTLMTRAQQTAPKNLSVRTGLGIEWIDKGKIDDAQALLEPVVLESPREWTAWLNLARVRYQKQDYVKAEHDLRRTIAVNPDSGIGYILLGQTQLKMNRAPEALASMRRAVELSPAEYRFHVIYGMVLASNDDCATAMTQFAAALALHPGDAFAQLARDRCRAAAKPVPVSQAPPGTH